VKNIIWSDEEPMSKSKKTVLIVDDEEDLTWSISRSLRRDRRALSVLCANSGDEALRLLQKNAVDVLVTDLRMPGKDGFDLIQFVRDRGLETRIIVMTAYGSEDVEKKVLAANCCYYVEKPFEIATLKEKIYAALQEEQSCGVSSSGGMNSQIRSLLALTRDVPDLMISVYQGKRVGRLYLSRGRIYHAELEGKRGQEALEEILAWPRGVLKASTGVTSKMRSVSKKFVD